MLPTPPADVHVELGDGHVSRERARESDREQVGADALGQVHGVGEEGVEIVRERPVGTRTCSGLRPFARPCGFG
jgi:hypothetical protein